MPKYVSPGYAVRAFTCASCGTYASQHWADSVFVRWQQNGQLAPYGLSICKCLSCKAESLWLDESKVQVHPVPAIAPMPHPDLPSQCKCDYMEARQISAVSPRGASALLRLCVQKLLLALGESGQNINEDIASLVRKGLPVQVQQALDVCRVVGNNAVHPGELNIDDSPELVHRLFELINFIVEQQIEQPRRIAEMFGQLPQGARDSVAKRDQ